MGPVLSPAIEICCSSFFYLLIVHVNVYIQQLEIWTTALLEEINYIDKFVLWMFVYLKETISIKAQNNEQQVAGHDDRPNIF